MVKIICGLALAVSLTACLKKHGCTDNDSINYSVDAKKNDNSCFYLVTGNFFWLENDYNVFLADSGSTYIYVFLDDKFIGEDSLANYTTGTLYCDDTFSMPFLDTNYYEMTEWRRLRVVDQNQKVLVDENMEVQANCQTYHLF